MDRKRPHESPGGTRSRAGHRDGRGVEGTRTPLISGQSALRGEAAWVMQTEPRPREADDLHEHSGSSTGKPWIDYEAL